MTVRGAAAVAVGILFSMPAIALAEAVEAGAPTSLEWVAILAGLALLPFLLIMVTAFVKVVVVLGILRSALGLQGVPPMQVIVGLALILTLFVMAPVGVAMADAARGALSEAGRGGSREGTGVSGLSGASWEEISAAASAAAEPLRRFLADHAHAEDTALFSELRPPGAADGLSGEAGDLLVLVPAFAISELKEAFQIGFLLFVPFLVIDLVVSSILMSLGMVMLSPTTVSLPFKLLLFVLVDGWYLLARGLVTSYQVM